MEIQRFFMLSISILLSHFFYIKSHTQRIDFKQVKEDVINAQNKTERTNAIIVLSTSFRLSHKDSAVFYANPFSNFYLEGKYAK